MGEYQHGRKEIVDFFCESLNQVNFDNMVLCVEAPFVTTWIHSETREQPESFYPFMNTEQVSETFANFSYYGVDMQEDHRYKEFSDFLIESGIYGSRTRQLNRMDSILSLILDVQSKREQLSEQEYDWLLEDLDFLHQEVSRMDFFYTPGILACLESRKDLAKYLTLPAKGNRKDRIAFRDSCMFERLKKIRGELRPRIVFWSANLHAASRHSMGNWERDGVYGTTELARMANWNVYSIGTVPIKQESKERKKARFDELVVFDKLTFLEGLFD